MGAYGAFFLVLLLNDEKPTNKNSLVTHFFLNGWGKKKMETEESTGCYYDILKKSFYIFSNLNLTEPVYGLVLSIKVFTKRRGLYSANFTGLYFIFIFLQ
jgi:hypothetical protein